MPKIAIIDLGTNSVKLLIANIHTSPEVYSPPNIKPIYEKVIITRIGRNLPVTKKLGTQGVRKTIEVIKKFLHICRQKKMSKIFILGTSALREAGNQKYFINQVKKTAGLDIKIISPREEAYFSYLGAVSSFPSSRRNKNLVIDIGGGSTELACGSSFKMERWWSLPLGAVKLTERFIRSDPISDKDYKRLVNYIKRKLLQVDKNLHPGNFYGVGGTITTLAAVSLKLPRLIPRKIQHYILTQVKVNELLNLFRKSLLTEREKIAGLEKARADIILAGTVILVSLMELCHIKHLRVSTRGLRYGFIINNLTE